MPRVRRASDVRRRASDVRRAAQKTGEGGGLSTGLKGAIVALSLLGFLFLYKYYDSKIALKRLSGVRLAPGVNYSSLAGAGLLHAFMWDIFLMLPMPLPGLDFDIEVWNKGLGRNTVYSTDTILCVVCMFTRAAYLPRFYGECMSDLGSNAGMVFARFNRIKLDETFTIKYVLANSLDCVTFIAALAVVMFAYAMMVFERPVADATLGHYANCVWLIVITMTTVGYGDEYPTTLMGRVVSIMASITAVVMLAITVNLVITKLSLTRAESKVVETMDKVGVRRQMKQCAAIAIQRWVRAYFEFQHGRVSHTNNSAQGYMVIPDMQSKKRKNQDLNQFVWSNVALLEALNDFIDAKRDNTIAHMRSDLCELAGALQHTLHYNQRTIESLRGQSDAAYTQVLFFFFLLFCFFCAVSALVAGPDAAYTQVLPHPAYVCMQVCMCACMYVCMCVCLSADSPAPCALYPALCYLIPNP